MIPQSHTISTPDVRELDDGTPFLKRPRKRRSLAPGAFGLDTRSGCLCCGSAWCVDVADSRPPTDGSFNLKCRPEVLALRQRLVADRRHFHQYPELSFKEHESARRCAARLRELGLQVTEGVAPGTGVVALLEGGAGAGPCIALRADMDALPIQEEPVEGQEPLPFASVNAGVMHACGHDAHMATMLCVAEVLSSATIRRQLRGCVKFIFQAAEENGNDEFVHGGAYEMVHRARVLDGVEASPSMRSFTQSLPSSVEGCRRGQGQSLGARKAIYGMHVWSFAPVGIVGVSPGCVMAGCDTAEIDVEGRGGHGAAPQGTVDAVLVMGHLITALHSIVSRNHDPQASAVLTIGSAEAGQAPNIIAARAKLRATIRCLDDTSQAIMKRRVREVSEGVGATFGAKVTVRYTEEAPRLVNDAEAAGRVEAAARSVVSAGGVQRMTTMASEDFAFYLEGAKSFPTVQVPGIKGCFFFVGASPKAETAGDRPHHNPAFTIDEDAMLVGASVFVELVESLLGSGA